MRDWENRWRGLREWFVSSGTRRPSQARLLRNAAVSGITNLVNTVAALNERRGGRSDRSADFRALARFFAQAPDDGAAHRLWRAAFALSPARHLTVDADTEGAWEAGRIPAGHPVGRRRSAADQPAAARDRFLRAARQRRTGPSTASGTSDSSPSGRARGRRDRRGTAPAGDRRAGPAVGAGRGRTAWTRVRSACSCPCSATRWRRAVPASPRRRPPAATARWRSGSSSWTRRRSSRIPTADGVAVRAGARDRDHRPVRAPGGGPRRRGRSAGRPAGRADAGRARPDGIHRRLTTTPSAAAPRGPCSPRRC